MGIAKLNIWVSDVADACGTWDPEAPAIPTPALMTIFDCKGVLKWSCGRYFKDGKWVAVPKGQYLNLPFKCGHLEVELPPGCYWVIAGLITPSPQYIHINYSTHVGIVEVGCDETACVKLFNPSVRLCWDWAKVGLQVLASNPRAGIDRGEVAEIEKRVEGLLRNVPRLPMEDMIEAHFNDLVKTATARK